MGDTDAAIARLLAEEHGYLERDYDYGLAVDDSDSDPDYGSRYQKAKKKKKGKRGRPPATTGDSPLPQSRPSTASAGASPDGLSLTGRRKRKDIGQQRVASRSWTEDEERLFQEALTMYGRDWKKCSDHVGSRDHRSIASHAQKFLIKALMRGEELPGKMIDTGRGYTLSGKPLDPNSSAAKAYGLKPEAFKKVVETGFLELGVHVTTLEMTDVPYRISRKKGPKSGNVRGTYKRSKKSAAAGAGGGGGGSTDDDGMENGDDDDDDMYGGAHNEGNGEYEDDDDGEGGYDYGNEERDGYQDNQLPQHQGRKNGQGGEQEDDDEEISDAEDDDINAALAASTAAAAAAAPSAPSAAQAETTAYARNRPRRQFASAKAQLGATTESLDLTLPFDFVGPIGTGAPLSQPFSVTMAPEAHIVMDFHAHLSTCEIIGLLGGTFDAEKRALCITAAYPCRRAHGSDSSTSVELDAESQVEVAEAMEERGLVPIGWYHSHPVFEPRPSAKDNENQRNYQALCRDSSTGLEPWVGAIVGPYAQHLPTAASQLQLWVVRQQSRQLTPYNMRYIRLAATEVPAEGSHVEQQLLNALDHTKEDTSRIEPSEIWRPYSRLQQGCAEGVPLSFAEKLQVALRVHLPRDQPAAVAEFLGRIRTLFKEQWGVDLPESAASTKLAAAALEASTAAAAAAAAAALVAPPPPAAALSGGGEGGDAVKMEEEKVQEKQQQEQPETEEEEEMKIEVLNEERPQKASVVDNVAAVADL